MANEYLKFTSQSYFSINSYNFTTQWNGYMYYSRNGTTWSSWQGESIQSLLDSTTNLYTIYLRGSNNTNLNINELRGTAIINLSGTNISCDGNIETLLDYNEVALSRHPSISQGAFQYLFYGKSNLIKAPDLYMATMPDYCCFYMFGNCFNLENPPEITATTIGAAACYYMFYQCSSLKRPSELPATSLSNNCYKGMFAGCTNIKLSATRTGQYTIPYRIPTTGTSAYVKLTDMFLQTGGTFKGTPSINTTYYLWQDKVNTLKIGSNSVDSVKVGSTEPSVYVGSTKVYG